MRLLTGERAGAVPTAAAPAAPPSAELQIVLGQDDTHAQQDDGGRLRDGDGGGDEQQERVGHEQSRTDVELGGVDEPVLQDGEWQQQQQQEVRGGGVDVEEHEEEEQPTSGAEERGIVYL